MPSPLSLTEHILTKMRVPPENRAAPFDRRLWRMRRSRAARLFEDADFLHREAIDRLADRLGDVKRGFKRAAVIGDGTGEMASILRGRFGVGHVIVLDASPEMAARSGATVVADEEHLPFADASLDLIVAPLTLHWTNDLPGSLIQMRRALRPDGLLMAALFAGQTLHELRGCLTEAEIEVTGGLSPRIAPMAELRDLGGLLQRAGLALPVADRETITVSYADPLKLMHDLRAMGETNVMTERHKAPMRRAVLGRTLALYAERHADAEGRVPASFEIAFLHGWAPSPDQPQPLRPGSATARLADALGVSERSAGEKAGRQPN